MPRHATANHWREEGTYSGLREVLAPEYAGLPPEQLEQLLEGVLGEVSPEDLENFWNGVKNFAKKAAPVFKKALPIVATVAGTALGGPIGGALGAAAGRAISGAIPGGAAGGQQPRRAGLPSRGKSQPPGGSRLPALPGGTPPGQPPVPAAAQLLRVINEPRTLQALTAMLLGSAGQRQVPVGGEPVPVGAFANLLGQLANQTASQYHQTVAGEPSATPTYLLNPAGEFVCDPADPAQRAEVLLELLNEADDEAYAEDDPEADDEIYSENDEDAEDEEDVDELYDELELAELYAEEED